MGPLAPPTRLELRQVRSFVALAEELHFGRAADRVALSQPALSYQIARLEEALGVSLVRRTRREVALTAAGQSFLREARRTLEQVNRAVLAARRASGEAPGVLELGCVGPMTRTLLPRLLHEARALDPAARVNLHELSSAEQVRGLRGGKLDLGIVCAPDEPELAYAPLHLDAVLLACAHDHPLARRGAVPLGDLAGQTVASPRREEPGHARLLEACLAQGVPLDVQDVHGLSAIMGLVAANLAVAFAPGVSLLAPHEGVAYRPLSPPLPPLRTQLAWRRDDPPAMLDLVLSAAMNAANGPDLVV